MKAMIVENEHLVLKEIEKQIIKIINEIRLAIIINNFSSFR